MSLPTTPPAATLPSARVGHTARLLACGIVAGPLFVAVVLLQAFTREGFDLGRHPLSLLSLGPLGWVQIANFVVAGVLFVGCAVGMRRVLGAGPGGTWGPLLVGMMGVGLVLGGVFVTDAGAGFPPGAPAGAPPEVTWHGMLHQAGAVLGFAMTAGCLVFARRFADHRRWGWVTACVATAAAAVAVTAWPDLETLSVRLLAGSAIQFGFVAALAAHLLRDLPDAAGRPYRPLARRSR